MNWDDLFAERERERARRGVSGQQGGLNYGQPQGRGFFGDTVTNIQNAVGSVGSFFGDMASNLVKPAAEAVEKVVSTAQAPGKKSELDRQLAEGRISQDDYNKKLQDTYKKDVGSKVTVADGKAKVESKDPFEFAKGFFATGADLGTSYGSAGTGAFVKSGLKAAAPTLIKEGAAFTGAQTLADVANDREVNLPANALSGFGGSFLGYGAGKLADVTAEAIRKMPNEMRTGVLKTAAQEAPVEEIPVNRLVSAEGAPDATRVAEYQARMENGGNIEPLIAMRDEKGNLTVEDGKHRLQAALNAGRGTLPVQVVTPANLRAVREGGYARIPGTADTPEPPEFTAGRLTSPVDTYRHSLTGEQPQIETPEALPGAPQTLMPENMGTRPTSAAKPLTAADARSPEENIAEFIDPRRRAGPDATAAPVATPQPDFSLPALPQGELPGPLTPKQAKAKFKKDGEVAEFVNKQPESNEPIPLAATAEETGNIAVRQTKGGKIKPVATNNAHITKDDVAAIRAIADDNTGSRFTATRTPEMNLEEAFATRGGAKSKEFRTLNRFNADLREHTAGYTKYVDDKRAFFEKFLKEYSVDGKKAADMRPYLEAADETTSNAALDAYRKEFGDKAADGMVKLRDWWRKEKDVARGETNAVIEKFAGKDRTIGDLGATYVPRVYKQGGIKGFRDAVLDVAHAGMDKIGGKNGVINLSTDNGYLSKTTESTGAVLRGAEGIPLNSEFAKPNTQFLSAAQSRTANAPVGEMEDPVTSMFRYLEATARARYYTPDIAKGRTLQKAIEYVNNETGNLRQMYQSFDDQINTLANKTSRFDRSVVDSKVGNAVVNAATKLQRNVARSTILGSATSTLAQTGQLPLVVAENGAGNFTKGMQQMISSIGRKDADDPLTKSSLMSTRYPDYEDIFTVGKGGRAANKATNIVAKPFRMIEHAASELAWRSSYNRALADGFVGDDAIREADRITARIIGERSPGARAALYESRALAPVSAYTLEVNQMYQTAKQYFKRDPKKAAKLVAAIWLYNQGYQAITGNKLNADPAQAGMDAAGILTGDQYTDENGNPIGVPERLVRAAGRLGGEALDATPLGNTLAAQLYPEQGFRVPFGEGARFLSRQDVFGNTNLGRYGGGTPIAGGISNPLLLTGIPGMAQLQRSGEGLRSYNEGASYTPSGDTRFNVEQSPENLWRSILFGMYGTTDGRAYLAEKNAQLAGTSGQ